MSSLFLVFNSCTSGSHPTRIDPRLTALCAGWILLADDAADDRVDDLRKAINGVPGEILYLGRVPMNERPGHLMERLRGRASHVLFLQTGNVIECNPGFHLDDAGRPEKLLHLAPARDLACWRTALVPAEDNFWEVDATGGIKVTEVKNARRNDHLRVLDYCQFPRDHGTSVKDLQALVDQHRKVPEAATAIRVADFLLKLNEGQQALDWYRTALDDRSGQIQSWQANLGAARCLMQLDADWPGTESHLAAAFDIDPGRMEPLFHLIAHYRASGDYLKACELAEVAYGIDEPDASVIFDLAIYRHRLSSEYAAACFELGRDDRCIDICNKTLRSEGVPEATRRELAGLRARAYERACPVFPVSIRRRNRLLVVVAFRNAGEFLKRCVSSIQQQTYPDYRVVLIDDASSDNALARLGELDERFVISVNKESAGILSNQIEAIRAHANDEDIVVHLDGDDWLAHENAFLRINDFFNRTRCWIMYGQYQTSHGLYGQCEPLVPGVAPDNQVARMHFPMHIRAYRASLFTDLLEQDPELAVLKDERGGFLDAVSDLALMRALIQLAGAERTRYNEEILYVYNRANPESHYRSRDALAIQRSQSRTVAAKQALRQITNQRRPRVRYHEKKVYTLFVSLDAMNSSLIEQWAGEGRLPNFARLLERCQSTPIRVPVGFGNDAFWNCIATGRTPDETGYFYRMKWNPQDYTVEFRSPAEQVLCDYFWTELARTDAEIAIIDIPEVKLGGRINGLEISEWLPHARASRFETCPAELREDVLARFGHDPQRGTSERSTPRTENETERDLGRMLEAIDQKTRGALHYLNRGGWDFFAVGYQQAHDAGHQFWHLHDSRHSRFSRTWLEAHGDPLLKIYQAIDHGIGTLVGAAGDDTEIIMIAGLATSAKMSCNTVLDRILWELEVHERRAAGEAYPDMDQLDRRRFIAIPHNNMSGAIRINLQGRESRGIVRDGDDYRQTIALLMKKLAMVTNTATGKAVVAQFVPVREKYTGTRVDELPDLFLLWTRDDPIPEVSAPWCGSIPVRVRSTLDTRSGDHIGEAMLYSSVAGVGGNGPVVDTTEIAGQLVALIQGQC